MLCSQCQEPTSGRFCGNCGAATAQESPVDLGEATEPVPQTRDQQAPGEPGSNPVGAQWVIRKLRGLKRGPAICLVIIVVSLPIALAAALASGNTKSNTQSDRVVESAAPVATPHDICALQVYAVATHLAQGRYEAEMTINGQRDPFIDVGQLVLNKFTQVKYQSGNATARQEATELAGTLCSTRLNDQVRANYPVDGTYPDDGSSDADSGGGGGGSRAPSCPNGGTLGSDRQGNMVCNQHQ